MRPAERWRLELAGSWREAPEAEVRAGLRWRPFRRADPLWTPAPAARAGAVFHCPFAAAAPLLRPRGDGRNLYSLAGECEVATLPGAGVGFDGLVFQGGRLFAFGPETAVRWNLRYLSRFRDITFEAGGRAVSVRSPEQLTAGADVHFEWHTAEDPVTYAALKPLYEASRRRFAGAGPAARRSRHRQLANLVAKRGYVYYYHLTHVLPLACLMRAALLADPEIEVLTAGAFDEHFALLGIDPGRLVPYDPSTLYEADLLHAASPVPFLLPPRELLALVRDTFSAGLPREPGCAVLIRRKPAQRTAFRNRLSESLGLAAGVDVCVLENHDEILAALRRRWPRLEVVDFDSDLLAPAQQIALFARARLVIGAHGSGLANLVFAPPGTRVLELMPGRSCFPLFWHLAQALAMPYAVHLVPGVTKYDNFAVPAEEVVRAAEQLMHAAAAPGEWGAPARVRCRRSSLRPAALPLP